MGKIVYWIDWVMFSVIMGRALLLGAWMSEVPKSYVAGCIRCG